MKNNVLTDEEIKILREISGFTWRPSAEYTGQYYKTLAALIDKGFIEDTSDWFPGQGGTPTLTDLGKAYTRMLKAIR